MSNAGYGQIGDFLRFARKIQSPVTGKTAIFWDLPVKFSHPLRAKRHFLGSARNRKICCKSNQRT